MTSQGLQIHSRYILAVIVYRTLLRLFESKQYTHQGALSAARLSHYGHILPRSYLQRQIIYHIGHIVAIAERHIVQLYAPVQLCHYGTVAVYLGLRLQDRLHHL